VAAESVVSEIFANLTVRGDKVDFVAGIGTADTSEIIRTKNNATRPACERIFE
jgi:hypothetical protein